MFKKIFLALFVVVTACLLVIHSQEGNLPSSVLYISWQRDPSTTMTIQWHNGKSAKSKVYYHKSGEEKWIQDKGSFQFLRERSLFATPLCVHTVELTGLEPDTEYTFCLKQTGPVYRFKTMPATLNRPIRFVVGGDVYHQSLSNFKIMNQQVAHLDPDFVVIGGDIAYTRGRNRLLKGRFEEITRWHEFFAEWKDQMVTSDGRLIPLLVVIGNHDLESTHEDPHKKSILFYEIFAFPDPFCAYRALDFGSYLSLIFLDTEHTYPVKGAQTQWLKTALSERENVPVKIPIYHVAAYPSLLTYQKYTAKQIRQNWVPLFEQYGVKTVFEHHNHTYKRTFPLKEDKVDPTGIVYLGDGAWGARARKPAKLDQAWYLEKAMKVNHVHLITLDAEKCTIQAINNQGQIFDETIR